MSVVRIERRSLDALAIEIRKEFALVASSFQSGFQHAARCGHLLIEAKAGVEHGGWLPWVEANLPFGERQARKYMQIATHEDEIANRHSSADFTINSALADLADRREPAASSALEAPDEIQASIITQKRAELGEEAAREYAESMGVDYALVGDGPPMAADPAIDEDDEEVIDAEVVEESDDDAADATSPPANGPVRPTGKAVRLPNLLGDLAALARVVEDASAAASVANKHTTAEEKSEWVKQWESAIKTLRRFGKAVEAS